MTLTTCLEGLTLEMDINGNARGTFASPTIDINSGSVQHGVRIFGAPEPASLMLLGLGVLAVVRKRRKKTA